jgi:predicted glycoside hydrolase/deacetylase ChbG (UPF0249 family)
MKELGNTPVKVVVTADDFGLAKSVNEGILVASREGVVRNTTLLVNFPDVKESVARLSEAEGLDLGIHLNLTSGPPVLKPEQVPSLVGNAGSFLGLVPFILRVILGRINWSEVRLELEGQIELGLHLGCNFSSITSHQHIHMLPQLTRLFSALAQAYDIPFIRLSRYHRASIFWPLRFKPLALFYFATSARSTLQGHRIFHNDYLINIPNLPTKKAVLLLCHTVRRLPVGVYELVCHPGYVDTMLQNRDHYTFERLAELAVLTAPEISAVFKEDGIELTTYSNLTKQVSHLRETQGRGNNGEDNHISN